MLGKLASLKLVAHDLGSKAGVVPSRLDPTLDALRARAAEARADAALRADAAAQYASAARALARAGDTLAAVLDDGGGGGGGGGGESAGLGCAGAADRRVEAGGEVRRVAGLAGEAAREAEAYASWARAVLEVGLAAVGEDALARLAKRKATADYAAVRVGRRARGASRGAPADAGAGADGSGGDPGVEALRAVAEREEAAYVAERDAAAAGLERAVAAARAGGERAAAALADRTAGVLSVVGRRQEPRHRRPQPAQEQQQRRPQQQAPTGVDWLTLADDLRLAMYLKFPDAVVVRLLPACADVRPAVLERSALRCVTLRAPAESAVEASPLHWASDAADAPGAAPAGAADVQYVVAKGTNFRSLRHVVLDLSVALVRDETVGAALHRGFYDVGVELHAHAAAVLDPALPVRVVGHSMGGAAAAIAALLLHRDGFRITALHLYGTPRFTDDAGAALFDRVFGAALLRVAHYDDVIRTLPPAARGGYRHCGRVIMLHADDSVWVLDESPPVEPARGVTVSSSRGFNVHRTSQYGLAVGRQVARLLGAPEPVADVAAAAAAAEQQAVHAVVAAVRDEEAAAASAEGVVTAPNGTAGGGARSGRDASWSSGAGDSLGVPDTVPTAADRNTNGGGGAAVVEPEA